jgi:hypothetical protein
MNAQTLTDLASAIRIRILAECRYEQTEAYLFASLAGFDMFTGYSTELLNSVIDSMLDAGELRSSIIDARAVGFGYLPTLTTIS